MGPLKPSSLWKSLLVGGLVLGKTVVGQESSQTATLTASESFNGPVISVHNTLQIITSALTAATSSSSSIQTSTSLSSATPSATPQLSQSALPLSTSILPSSSSATSSLASSSATPSPTNRSGNSGLRGGVKAAIIVTILVLFAAILLSLFIIQRRRINRKRCKDRHPYLTPSPEPTHPYEDGIIPYSQARSTPSMSSHISQPKPLALNILSPVSPLSVHEKKDISNLAELEGGVSKEAVELCGREVGPPRVEMPDFEKWERDEEDKRRKKERNRERARRGMSWLSLS